MGPRFCGDPEILNRLIKLFLGGSEILNLFLCSWGGGGGSESLNPVFGGSEILICNDFII